MMFRNRNRQKGFTLIELLIVVAIIGIIAAILIPNLLDALQKSKQKRSVADMRNLGTAWMSWLIDQVGAASAGQTKTYDASAGFTAVTYTDLFASLHPTETFFYMQEVPEFDGWRYPLSFGLADNLLNAQVIIVASGGRDGGAAALQNWTVGPFVSSDYDQDIVWADGYFVRWPDSVAQQ